MGNLRQQAQVNQDVAEGGNDVKLAADLVRAFHSRTQETDFQSAFFHVFQPNRSAMAAVVGTALPGLSKCSQRQYQWGPVESFGTCPAQPQQH